MSVAMITAGGVTAMFGRSAVPFDVRMQFPICWAVDFPGYAVFGAMVLFIAALLWRPGRTVYVKDFSA